MRWETFEIWHFIRFCLTWRMEIYSSYTVFHTEQTVPLNKLPAIGWWVRLLMLVIATAIHDIVSIHTFSQSTSSIFGHMTLSRYLLPIIHPQFLILNSHATLFKPCSSVMMRGLILWVGKISIYSMYFWLLDNDVLIIFVCSPDIEVHVFTVVFEGFHFLGMLFYSSYKQLFKLSDTLKAALYQLNTFCCIIL